MSGQRVTPLTILCGTVTETKEGQDKRGEGMRTEDPSGGVIDQRGLETEREPKTSLSLVLSLPRSPFKGERFPR